MMMIKMMIKMMIRMMVKMMIMVMIKVKSEDVYFGAHDDQHDASESDA